MTMKPITLVLSLLTISLCALTSNYAAAGLKSGFTGKDYEYDVQGEIYVAPDYAVLPVDIYVTGATYQQALSVAKGVATGAEESLRKQYGQLVSVIWAGTDTLGANSKNQQLVLSFFVRSNIAAMKDYWAKTELVAGISDAIEALRKKHDSDKHINIRTGQIEYHIADIESYRKGVIDSMTKKIELLRISANKLISGSPKVTTIDTDQQISAEVISIEKAALRMDAQVRIQVE